MLRSRGRELTQQRGQDRYRSGAAFMRRTRICSLTGCSPVISTTTTRRARMSTVTGSKSRVRLPRSATISSACGHCVHPEDYADPGDRRQRTWLRQHARERLDVGTRPRVAVGQYLVQGAARGSAVFDAAGYMSNKGDVLIVPSGNTETRGSYPVSSVVTRSPRGMAGARCRADWSYGLMPSN